MRFKIILATMLVSVASVSASTSSSSAAPSGPMTLEQCRALALENNKQLMITRQQINKAQYQNKEAFAAYLPAIDFAGGYTYNQKKISIFDSDQLLPIKNFDPKTGGYQFSLVTNPETGAPVKGPNGEYIPSQVALIPKESMTYDIHNVFFGAVTLTQPIFMGGKIVAMNKLTHFAEEIAREMHIAEAQNVIYAVDAAYWQVVSLKAKRDLAESYVNLLDSLDHNVSLMLEEGVATKADKLSVDVKLNAARVDLTKVDNGLVLSRMALAQVCGLPINSPMVLVDEEARGLTVPPTVSPARIDEAYQARPDLRALELGIQAKEQQRNVARADMLPQVALVGAYSFSTPNMFDGFSKKLSGAFSVGAVVKIPLWHWGGNYYKYKAAEVDRDVMKLKLEDARELVDLQITQASYRAQEALKTYNTTVSNLESANENLRTATLGFKEGVVTSDDVMSAQTAWLKANSESIDAMIDVHLCDTYLSKVLGTMPVNMPENQK